MTDDLALRALDIVDNDGGTRLTVTGIEAARREAPGCTCAPWSATCSDLCGAPLHVLANGAWHTRESFSWAERMRERGVRDLLASYPFEVTLPHVLYLGGLPLPGTLAEQPASYRTYHARHESFGDRPDQVRLVAIFRRQTGDYAPVKNPDTHARLRQALGL
jgi:hypothetical protein